MSETAKPTFQTLAEAQEYLEIREQAKRRLDECTEAGLRGLYLEELDKLDPRVHIFWSGVTKPEHYVAAILGMQFERTREAREMIEYLKIFPEPAALFLPYIDWPFALTSDPLAEGDPSGIHVECHALRVLEGAEKSSTTCGHLLSDYSVEVPTARAILRLLKGHAADVRHEEQP